MPTNSITRHQFFPDLWWKSTFIYFSLTQIPSQPNSTPNHMVHMLYMICSRLHTMLYLPWQKYFDCHKISLFCLNMISDIVMLQKIYKFNRRSFCWWSQNRRKICMAVKYSNETIFDINWAVCFGFTQKIEFMSGKTFFIFFLASVFVSSESDMPFNPWN